MLWGDNVVSLYILYRYQSLLFICKSLIQKTWRDGRKARQDSCFLSHTCNELCTHSTQVTFFGWVFFLPIFPHILLGTAVVSFRYLRACRNVDIIVSGKLSWLAHFALWKIFVPVLKHSSLSLLHQKYKEFTCLRNVSSDVSPQKGPFYLH